LVHRKNAIRLELARARVFSRAEQHWSSGKRELWRALAPISALTMLGLRQLDVALTEGGELTVLAQDIDVRHVVGSPGEPSVARDARLLFQVFDRVFQESELLGFAVGIVAGKLGQPERLREAALVGLDMVDEPLGMIVAIRMTADVHVNAQRIDAAAAASGQELLQRREGIGLLAVA